MRRKNPADNIGEATELDTGVMIFGIGVFIICILLIIESKGNFFTNPKGIFVLTVSIIMIWFPLRRKIFSKNKKNDS